MTRYKLKLKLPLATSSKTLVYQTKDGAIKLKTDSDQENVWASQAQIVELFKIDQSVASRHIKNVFKDGEVDEKSNMQKMHIANSDKPVAFYSLDVILSVGYRTNSKVAIEFRKWATRTLKSFINEGVVIDKKRVAKNYEKFIKTIDEIKLLVTHKDNFNSSSVIDLVKGFAETWLSLDAYDKNRLTSSKVTKRNVFVSSDELRSGINELKIDLIRKGEATEIFANEKTKDALEGIVGNIMQSFDGTDLYKSLEEKAVHLFYFIVKNHPFTDGNKRSGAFAFIWFLNKFSLIDINKIDTQTLTALTILIAESNPKDKDKIIGLVMILLENAKEKFPIFMPFKFEHKKENFFKSYPKQIRRNKNKK
jgi:prophage maintenance system killer protein